MQKEKGKNEIYRHDLTVLINNGSELRKEITDLELDVENLKNNIEFLFYNLPENVKELVRPEGQN